MSIPPATARAKGRLRRAGLSGPARLRTSRGRLPEARGIAARYGQSVQALVAANELASPDRLRVGQAHRRPTARDPAAATSANLPRKAAHTATGGGRGPQRACSQTR